MKYIHGHSAMPRRTYPLLAAIQLLITCPANTYHPVEVLGSTRVHVTRFATQHTDPRNNPRTLPAPGGFEENVGQIHDTRNEPRPSIKFSYRGPIACAFLALDTFTFVFARAAGTVTDGGPLRRRDGGSGMQGLSRTICRTDLVFLPPFDSSQGEEQLPELRQFSIGKGTGAELTTARVFKTVSFGGARGLLVTASGANMMYSIQASAGRPLHVDVPVCRSWAQLSSRSVRVNAAFGGYDLVVQTDNCSLHVQADESSSTLSDVRTHLRITVLVADGPVKTVTILQKFHHSRMDAREAIQADHAGRSNVPFGKPSQ